jgi:hypothetical protein
MADISQGIDAYFWITVLTVFCTGFNLIVRYAYRSKCKRCKICCIEIERDIEVEEREDTAAAANTAANTSSKQPSEPTQ